VLPWLTWVRLGFDLRDRATALATSLRLRGADAVYVAVADRLSIPLVTWDPEQLTRAGSRIQVRPPS
jgi:predicted nucleic acid-binding protein